MITAGWIVTSIPYFWATAFGMLSLVGLAKIIRDERIRGIEYVFYFSCNFFAVGSLQLAPLLLGIYTLIIIYLLIKKRYPVFVFVQYFIIIINLVYHLTVPGSRTRFIAEISYSFPAFQFLTLTDKLQLGFTSTVFHFINDNSLFFLLFCIVLFIGVCAKHQKVHYRMIALVPLAANLLWGSFHHVFGSLFINIYHIMLSVGSYKNINTSTFFHYKAYIPLGVAFLIICCIAASMFLVFGKTYKSLLVQSILAGGFASRMILSFSPTIFASEERTFIFMYFCMIVCAVLVYQEIQLLCKERHRQYLLYGTGLVAVLIAMERIQRMW